MLLTVVCSRDFNSRELWRHGDREIFIHARIYNPGILTALGLPRYNNQMHYEGVMQLRIGRSITWLQPHSYAALDADEIISPWSMLDRWLIGYTTILFLHGLSKIAYR